MVPDYDISRPNCNYNNRIQEAWVGKQAGDRISDSAGILGISAEGGAE